MLRRQFLIGIATMVAVPSTASARRRGFSFISKNDSPETRRTKIWIGVGLGGFVGAVAIGRAVFWVLKRLDQDPPRSTPRFMPSPVPLSTPKAPPPPVASPRKTATTTSFGRRTR